MNSVVLMGRLTKDPDVRYTQGQNSMCVAKYTLAVDRRQKSSDGSKQADFIRCAAFGKSAEFAEKYLHKGVKICIRGRIQTGSYKDKNGNTVYTTDVIAEDQEFCESKAANNTAAQSGSDYQQGGGNSQQGGAEQALDGFMSIPDAFTEELPFM